MVFYTRGGRPHLWVLAFSLLEVCLGVVICNSVLVGEWLGVTGLGINVGLLAVADGHEDTCEDDLEFEDDVGYNKHDMNVLIIYLKHD